MGLRKNKNTGRKWKLSDIGRFFLNSIRAIAKGEFLLKLDVGKYFPQIAWTFFLFTMLILFSLMVDSTLAKVEKNRKTLVDLEILYTQKTYELVTLNRRSSVSRLLEENGSALTEPQKPAVKLK